MVMSTRKFGIELEVINRSIGRSEMANKIKNELHVPCEHHNYPESRDYSTWTVTEDGSLTHGGMEVVSPPLSGRGGLNQCKRVASFMLRNGTGVDRSCGFHVHIDSAGLTVSQILNVVRRYMKFEDTIDSFMAPSRRADRSEWCASNRNQLPVSMYENNHWGRIERENRLSAFIGSEEIEYGSRYFKVNLRSLIRHGTIEFRQHSGTCNPTKIAMWVKFLLAFVEASKTSVENDTWERGIPRTVVQYYKNRIVEFSNRTSSH